MRIVHVNTNEVDGGAARATFRLHSGLRAMGQESHLVVSQKQASDSHTYLVNPSSAAPQCRQIGGLEVGPLNHLAAIQQHYINNNRTDLSNILFSFPYPGLDLTVLPIVRSADIIHLHWIAGFQSLTTLNALLKLGKPVFWTLHDMWPFTGGCHSSGGCTHYQLDCRDCPQLQQDPLHLPAAVLEDKRQLLSAPILTVIAPSEKMAGSARRSTLFRETRIEVIHNSIDTASFQPISKPLAKQYFNIPADARVIAFGAENAKQRSKGIPELISVIRQCQQNPEFRAMLNAKQLYFICCGNANSDILALGLPLLNLGLLRSDEKLRYFYSAADVFVQPSLEESFGNMAIESLCCGTPVIGFDVGVAPEVINDAQLGKVLPVGDVQSMTEAVLDFANNAEKWRAMQEDCHKQTSERFAQKKQAQHCLELYRELADQNSSAPAPAVANASLAFEMAEQSVNLPWDVTLGSAVQTIETELSAICLSKELESVKARLPHYQSDYQALQETLDHREERLQILRDRIQNLRQQIQMKDDELQAMQEQLTVKDHEIEAMKTSKFWKLRMLWMKVRSRLGRTML